MTARWRLQLLAEERVGTAVRMQQAAEDAAVDKVRKVTRAR